MQVETITMDPRIARIHFADYRKRVRANREERRKRIEAATDSWQHSQAAKLTKLEQEDRELLKAYQALCRGVRIIDVASAVRKAGVDPKLRLPLLAIVRADCERIEFRTGTNPQLWPDPYPAQRERRGESWNVLPASVYPAEITNNEWRKTHSLPLRASALVPSVPAPLRPDNLSDYYILWEAEWRADAPKDPLLLSRVNRTMFAVVAQWDLSPLEQRVLEGRL